MYVNNNLNNAQNDDLKKNKKSFKNISQQQIIKFKITM